MSRGQTFTPLHNKLEICCPVHLKINGNKQGSSEKTIKHNPEPPITKVSSPWFHRLLPNGGGFDWRHIFAVALEQ